MINCCRGVVGSLILLGCVAHAAKLAPLSLSSAQLPAAPRFLFESKPNLKALSAGARALAEMKLAQSQQKYGQCSKLAEAALHRASEAAAWIHTGALSCAWDEVNSGAPRLDGLRKWIMRVDAKPEWRRSGPQRTQLKRLYIQGALKLIESDLKTVRLRAWNWTEKLFNQEEELNNDEKAELYRLAGEVLFLDQSLEAAQSFFERSLALRPSTVVQDRLKAFAKTDESKKIAMPADVPAVAVLSDEDSLATQIHEAFKKGDLLSAVDDTLKLAKQYPGSTATTLALEKVIDNYLTLLGKLSDSLQDARDRYQRALLKFQPEVQTSWAKKLYLRGFYRDAYLLSQKAFNLSTYHSTSLVSLLARSAYAVDQLAEAETYYQILSDQHSGTDESKEATLSLGLIQFRKKKYSRAVQYFEKLLLIPQIQNHELNARYWLWRSLQQLQSPKAPEQAEILKKNFPFSYYGLRAQTEGQAELSYVWSKKALKLSLWLPKNQQKTYRRALLLIQGGWFEEASLELQTLPPFKGAEGQALMGLLYAQAFDFRRAIGLVNQAWDQDPGLRNPPMIYAAFPMELKSIIDQRALQYKMDPTLVRSLIKQESAFGLRAVSRSNAMGLMQLIPPTAQEVAGQLGIKLGPMPESVFHYETNIQMGTFYLGAMLDHFNHHVPLALAAYNAGPTRLERWIKSRPSLNGITKQFTSNPHDELWIDELPWSETKFYVKAILRNALLYKVLEEGRVKISEPIWADLVTTRLSK